STRPRPTNGGAVRVGAARAHSWSHTCAQCSWLDLLQLAGPAESQRRDDSDDDEDQDRQRARESVIGSAPGDPGDLVDRRDEDVRGTQWHRGPGEVRSAAGEHEDNGEVVEVEGERGDGQGS